MSIKKVVAPISNFFSQNTLVKWTGRKTIFPFYHTISDDDLPYISNLYPLRSVNQFKCDLEYFCKHFNPISIEEVYRRIDSSSQLDKPAFHLSFDDGLKEIHSTIAPILEAKGIPATFFVNSNFVDNKKLFYRYKIGIILDALKKSNSDEKVIQIQKLLEREAKWNTDSRSSFLELNYNNQKLINQIAELLNLDFDNWLHEHTPYASSDQIRDLEARGFTIGSHSADHPRFKNIEPSKQKLQVEDSFAFLEKHFNIDDRFFSFPFGDEGVKSALFNWMYKEGKCKMSFGVSGIKDDFCPFHIHRIPMDECQINTENFIKSEYLYFMIKSVFNKNQIKRN